MKLLRTKRWRAGMALGAASFVVTGVLAGCGSSGGNSNAASDPGANSACMAGSQKILDTAMQKPDWKLPATPPDLKGLAGKTAWFISPANAVPVIASAANGFQQAAAHMGLVGKVFDGEGNVSKWNAGVDVAVADHAAFIVLYAENPALLSASLAKAKAAHIPVVALATQEPGTPPAAGVDAALSPDPNLAGTWEAAYALHETNCAGPYGFLYTSTFDTEALQLPTFKSTVSNLCPNCEVVVQNIPSSQSQSDSGTIAVSMVNRYPDMKMLVSAAAANTDVMVPALKTRGWQGKLIDWSGDQTNIGYIQAGNIESADVLWPPPPALSYASADLGARLAAGQPAVQENLPIQLVTKDNLANATALDNYEALWTALWNQGK